MKIALTGSIAFDYLMSFPGHFKEHLLADKLQSVSLSFLVDKMIKRRGGIGPNIGYTMALLGGSPTLFGTVGQDFEEYRDWLEENGVDTNGVKVIPDEFTASFFATTDYDNCQIASFYPGAMSYAAEVKLSDWGGDPLEYVVISPTDPKAMIQYVDVAPTIVEIAGGIPDLINTGIPNTEGNDYGFDGESFLDVLLGKRNYHNEYVYGT